MSFDHAASFGRVATDYRDHRPSWPDALLDWIAAAAPSRALAVDVATGGGQAALGLADRFDRVVATDWSPELLATIPHHDRLETRVQSAQALQLDPGVTADAITTFQALHWFAGDAFWARVRAALAPGGVYLAACYSWFTVDPRVDAVLRRALLEPLAPHWSERNTLLFDGYRTIPVPLTEIETPAFTLELRWTRAQLLAYVGTWSAVTRLRESGRELLPEVAQALEVAWPDEAPRAVAMPLATRAFRP